MVLKHIHLRMIANHQTQQLFHVSPLMIFLQMFFVNQLWKIKLTGTTRFRTQGGRLLKPRFKMTRVDWAISLEMSKEEILSIGVRTWNDGGTLWRNKMRHGVVRDAAIEFLARGTIAHICGCALQDDADGLCRFTKGVAFSCWQGYYSNWRISIIRQQNCSGFIRAKYLWFGAYISRR